MTAINPKFGERMKTLRKARGLTMGEAGAKLGISQAQISDYENNRRNISSMRLAEFARLYNVSTDYLLGMNEGEKLNPNHDPKDEAIFAHFLSEIKQYSLEKFKIIVKQMDEYRKLFEKLG